MTSFLIIAAFVGGVYFGWWLALHQPAQQEQKEETREEMSMDMARQWANIMSYDGTERGQIGEDDYGDS